MGAGLPYYKWYQSYAVEMLPHFCVKIHFSRSKSDQIKQQQMVQLYLLLLESKQIEQYIEQNTKKEKHQNRCRHSYSH